MLTSIEMKLDELTARRQLKSPRSLSGRSIHLTLVTKWSWSWSWMTYCHPLCAMSIGPPILRYSYFKIWPWKSMVKVMCGQRSRSRLTLEIQRSRLWSRSNLMVTFEALEFNRYVCFSFRGNRTIFGWDIANSIFDLENSKSRSWQRSNLGHSKVKVMVKVKPDGHIWGLGVQSICLLFVSWQSDHFWLRYSQFYIWPWKFKVKVMAKVKPDGHIWALESNWYVCFSFRGNRTIFGWDIANSIFDLEKSRSRSWRKSTKI